MTKSQTVGVKKLEAEGDAAADGAGRLHQVNGFAVVAHNGNVALGEQIAEIDKNLHVSGKDAIGDGLADKEIEIRIGLAGRGIEEIDRGQGLAVGPTIGRDPAS